MTRLVLMKHILMVMVSMFAWCANAQVVALKPPSHGDWKGHAPGTWIVTKYTTRYSQTNKTDNTYLYKRILVGEDEDGGVHLVGGTCDDAYEYIRKPYAAIHPRQAAWYGPVVAVETNTITVGDTRLALLDKKAVTNTVESGKRTYTRRMLAVRPDFMVAFRNEITDEFRDESYRMLEVEIPIGVATEERFGRNVTMYRSRYSRFLDGKQIGAGTVTRSPELPVSESSQKTVGLDGKPINETSIEIVAVGVDVNLLTSVPPPVTGPRFTDEPDPESAFYKANVKLLKEQGFNDLHVQKLMPNMSNYDSMTNIYHRVAPAWKAHAADQSPANREALVEALGWTYSTSHPLTEPRTEALLLEITKISDPVVASRALSMLAGFCSPRYMRQLEDYAIKHQLTDPKVFDAIAAYFHGNPSRVLREVSFPLNEMREHHLIHAPPADAVTELLRRSKKDERSFSLEHLLGFDDDRVRQLLSELASKPIPDGSRGKMRLVHLIQGLGIYNVPEATAYLSKLIDELSAPDTATDADKRMAMFRPMLLARALQATLETGNPDLRGKVVKLLKKDMSSLLMLAMTTEDVGAQELLFSLRPYLTNAEVKKLLGSSVKTPYGELSMSSRLDQFAILLDKRFLGDVDALTEQFLPFYEPGKDYASEALVYQKRWYMERKGIKQPPWALASRKQPKELIAKILPSYGEAGTKILLDLAGIQGFRPEALKGLARTSGDRKALLAHVKRIGRPRDPSHEANPYDIAIWVLGDRSVAENMEQRLKYPPNHVGSRPREYLPWLDRDYLIDITKRRDKIGILNVNRPWLIKALSKYRDREAWELIWKIWEETATPKNNIAYARLFNEVSGRHFGLRKSEMLAWIRTLAPYNPENGSR